MFHIETSSPSTLKSVITWITRKSISPADLVVYNAGRDFELVGVKLACTLDQLWLLAAALDRKFGTAVSFYYVS